jgi:hypothetical protein
MSTRNETISAQWEELRVLFETTSIDVAKGVRGNDSAAARARRSVRDLRKRATSILKEMIAESKDVAAEKASSRPAKSV